MGKQGASSKQASGNKKTESTTTTTAPKRHELVTLLQKQQDDKVALIQTLKDRIITPATQASTTESSKKTTLFKDLKADESVRFPSASCSCITLLSSSPLYYKTWWLAYFENDFELEKGKRQGKNNSNGHFFPPLSSSNQADCWKFVGNLLPASLDFIATGSEDDDEDASVPTAVS